MGELRIASFLPAATEMVYQLGLEDHLVGVTHECDYPEKAKSKPVLVDCALDLSGLSTKEIDQAVAARIGSGKSLYKVDEEKLKKAAPNLLITQNLCQVCGPAGNEVSQVLKTLKPVPEILWQTPFTFDEVLEACRELGRKTDRLEKAENWISQARAKINNIAAKTARLKRKIRVAFIEWVDPIYCAGHWVPQMLEWAGGEDRNSQSGGDSIRISWEAVRNNKVFAVDANAYFARPGPRIVEGVELLAHLIHPDDFPWSGPTDDYRKVL